MAACRSPCGTPRPCLALGLAGLSAPTPAPAGAPPTLERLTGWNRLALNAVRLTSAGDAASARLYAMVNVAAYDAVNAITGSHEPALVRAPGPRLADPQAAAVAAAHTVLAGLDAARKPEYDARLAADLASTHPGHRRDAGLAWGARLLALLTMALSDTTIVTVGAKFQRRRWRPATAIVQADTDGNPYTASDPAWLPRAGSTASTPEWVSGHSSYSATGAAILAGFFCTDAIAFDHTTDSAPGGAGGRIRDSRRRRKRAGHGCSAGSTSSSATRPGSRWAAASPPR